MSSFSLDEVHVDDNKSGRPCRVGSSVSRTAKIGMAGNAMHIQCIASVMLYVITHGAMPLSQLRSHGIHESLCHKYVPASYLSSSLTAIASLVAGPGRRP